MDTKAQTLDWKTIIISVVIIMVLSTVLNILITGGYGFYIGFQTRGDSDIINQSVAEFIRSFPYISIMALLTGLLIFWRARGLVRTSPQQAGLNTAVIAGLTLALGFLMATFLSGLEISTILIQSAAQLVVAALAVYAIMAQAKSKMLGG